MRLLRLRITAPELSPDIPFEPWGCSGARSVTVGGEYTFPLRPGCTEALVAASAATVGVVLGFEDAPEPGTAPAPTDDQP